MFQISGSDPAIAQSRKIPRPISYSRISDAMTKNTFTGIFGMTS